MLTVRARPKLWPWKLETDTGKGLGGLLYIGVLYYESLSLVVAEQGTWTRAKATPVGSATTGPWRDMRIMNFRSYYHDAVAHLTSATVNQNFHDHSAAGTQQTDGD